MGVPFEPESEEERKKREHRELIAKATELGLDVSHDHFSNEMLTHLIEKRQKFLATQQPVEKKEESPATVLKNTTQPVKKPVVMDSRMKQLLIMAHNVHLEDYTPENVEQKLVQYYEALAGKKKMPVPLRKSPYRTYPQPNSTKGTAAQGVVEQNKREEADKNNEPIA